MWITATLFKKNKDYKSIENAISREIRNVNVWGRDLDNTTEDKLSFDGLTGVTATSGTAAPTDAGSEEGANATAALIDGTVYVIDNETQPIFDQGEEAVADFTSLTDVADYLGEAYTSTSTSDAAIFIINDPSK